MVTLASPSLRRGRLSEITPPQGGESLLANPPAHTSQPRIGSGGCLLNVSESTQALVTAFSTRGFYVRASGGVNWRGCFPHRHRRGSLRVIRLPTLQYGRLDYLVLLMFLRYFSSVGRFIWVPLHSSRKLSDLSVNTRLLLLPFFAFAFLFLATSLAIYALIISGASLRGIPRAVGLVGFLSAVIGLLLGVGVVSDLNALGGIWSDPIMKTPIRVLMSLYGLTLVFACVYFGVIAADRNAYWLRPGTKRRSDE